jgi:tRNA A37 methylthiotransferase MiaB
LLSVLCGLLVCFLLSPLFSLLVAYPIRLPVQSGSTSMLERMRRGYSREAYMELVALTKRLIPEVTLL